METGRREEARTALRALWSIEKGHNQRRSICEITHRRKTSVVSGRQLCTGIKDALVYGQVFWLDLNSMM